MLDALILAAVLLQPPRLFLWEYATAEIATASVNRFELKLDDGAWTDVGRLAAADQTGVTEGSVIYQASVGALTLGEHTASLRACNPVECGEAESITFTVTITPGKVQKFHIGGGL